MQVAVIELDYVEDAKALRAEEFDAVGGVGAVFGFWLLVSLCSGHGRTGGLASRRQGKCMREHAMLCY